MVDLVEQRERERVVGVAQNIVDAVVLHQREHHARTRNAFDMRGINVR